MTPEQSEALQRLLDAVHDLGWQIAIPQDADAPDQTTVEGLFIGSPLFLDNLMDMLKNNITNVIEEQDIVAALKPKPETKKNDDEDPTFH